MLTSLCWLPFVAFLAPAGITHSRLSVVLVPPVADTGTVADTAAEPAPVLLTTDVVTSYIAVEKALKMYWAEHSEQARVALTTHVHKFPIEFGDSVLPTEKTVMDYAFWAQQDTALAALFKQSQVDPSKLGPTELTVSRSIVAALQYRPVDVATVAGKNIAAVRAHQQELTEEWRQMKKALGYHNMLKSISNFRFAP